VTSAKLAAPAGQATAPVVLRLSGITKRFGAVVANDDVSLELRAGEVLALLGENGAGKSTLVSILFGHYEADTGTIEVFGKPLPPGEPRAALAAGIGMVHQHFTLADNLSVLDNVLLGTEPLFAWRSRRAAGRAALLATAQRFGLAVAPDARVGTLSVGERQRVEILKALLPFGRRRGARILILDEPTAVLTPQESRSLFATLRQMVAEGLAIVFISHKLDEVLRVADRIAVLRGGRLVAERRGAGGGVRDASARPASHAPIMDDPGPGLPALDLNVGGANVQAALHAPMTGEAPIGSDAVMARVEDDRGQPAQHQPISREPFTGGGALMSSNRAAPAHARSPDALLDGPAHHPSALVADKAALAEAMVGHRVAPAERKARPHPGAPVLELDAACVDGDGRRLLDRASLVVRSGEIVAIAGVAGNGQRTLAAVLCGQQALDSGRLHVAGRALPPHAAAFVAAGVARVPEDRQAEGVVGDLSLWENAVLEQWRRPAFSRRGWLRRDAAMAHAAALVQRFDVRGGGSAGVRALARRLSGGNMQKLILGRALRGDPDRVGAAPLIVAHQPTWGLDVGAVAYVHQQLLDAATAGSGVLLLSEDLDEVLALADRIAVIHHGRLTAALRATEWTLARLGLAMAGAQHASA
jgi:simple sugar transport system ATP-binding protein